MNNEEYFEISRELETHHAVFYTMWEIGKPVFTERISTAGVTFDREGDCLAFEFNPKYWKNLSNYERAFVIGHECLHVILNHGFRIQDAPNVEIANQALDIVVNHTLVNNFGFDRKKIVQANDLCWVDTIFPNSTIPDNESFEFYMRKLLQNEVPLGGGTGKLVDDHSGLSNNAEELEGVCRGLNKQLSDEEKEGIKETIDKHFQNPEQTPNKETESHKPGTEAGEVWTFAQVEKVKKKKKWETVIKNWAKQYTKTNFKDIEQWARTNRRFTFISSELLLPTEMEDEKEEEGKIEVWFFQDTSGSCSGFRDRFFKAALSLPSDRFEVRMHCFDTRVYETTLESKKLYGFGGTSFHIMEDYIQKKIKTENLKYPKAVFVITDGYGDDIKPAYPQNWYWFLSTSYKRYIHEKCNIFDLSNFE